VLDWELGGGIGRRARSSAKTGDGKLGITCRFGKGVVQKASWEAADKDYRCTRVHANSCVCADRHAAKRGVGVNQVPGTCLWGALRALWWRIELLE
jgi:hypothetical protein